MALRKLVLVLLVLLVPSAVYAFICAGQTARVATLRGHLVSAATGEGCEIAWIEQDDEEATLVVLGRPGGQAKAILRAPMLSGIAVSSGAVFVTRSEGPGRHPTSISLLRVALAGGGPDALAALPSPAADLAVGDGYVCWREHHSSLLPGVNFVSAGEAFDVIRARRLEGDDTVRVPAPTPEQGGDADLVSLLGVRAGSVFWLEYREDASAGETVLKQAALPLGEPKTLARELGRQSAVLSRDGVLWTAPSAEAGAERSFRSVKRLLFGHSSPEVIADWFEPSGRLEASDGTVYLRERSRLWTVGQARGEQRARPRSFPNALGYHVVGQEEYVFVRTRSGLELVARPLSWKARLSRMLGR